MAQHNKVGSTGESIAVSWLSQKGFAIRERNYRKKYGEIDIIAFDSGGILHFIEVKTVSYKTKEDLNTAVSHETWRPEEMVHIKKRDRLKKVIQTWLIERDCVGKWQIDILTVKVVPHEKYARIKLIADVIFE